MKNTQPSAILAQAAAILALGAGCVFTPVVSQRIPVVEPVVTIPAIDTALSTEVKAPEKAGTKKAIPFEPAAAPAGASTMSYPVVDTSQGKCYNNKTETACPASSSAFFGQDAQYAGRKASYRDNGDGTVSDLVTGLMWQQDPGQKVTFPEDMQTEGAFSMANYSDWRVPTIKELYSLILFDGMDVGGCTGTCQATPFIDTRYFKFSYGDASLGERTIDSQFMSSTKYVANDATSADKVFGVNFADGRIKGYGLMMQNSEKKFYLLHVRGGNGYGQNKFVDLGDGMVKDEATGLVWMKPDSGTGMDWAAALGYCENMVFAGKTDWRLPDVKELQSIVDYFRSPSTSSSAAIDPIFNTSSITNEAGQADYPFYWSSTTHPGIAGHGSFAAYVAFGRAMGYMGGWVDVHGAGAQRSDPKTGSASQYPQGHGPQGDSIRVENYARCVRGGDAILQPAGSPQETRPSMSIESTGVGQAQTGSSQSQALPGGAPPQEAVMVCTGKQTGSACQFEAESGATILGTCATIRQQLACVPAGMTPTGMQP